MDASNFREEIINYIDLRYKQFCAYQKVAMDILSELDRVCKKNNINYFLAFGSLLGAIRDHSQIPWDYDIDTVIKINDKINLLKALNEELGEDYYYEYINNNSRYPASCIRVCKKGYSMMALHVDVFFLVGTPNDESKRTRYVCSMRRIMKLRTTKYIHYYSSSRPGGFLLRSIRALRRLPATLLPIRMLNYLENKLMMKYPISLSSYCFACQDVYKVVYPSEIFDNTEKVIINGKEYNVPEGYNEFLSINYGKWQSYLPIQSRFEEFYRMCGIVEKRQSLYEQQPR